MNIELNLQAILHYFEFIGVAYEWNTHELISLIWQHSQGVNACSALSKFAKSFYHTLASIKSPTTRSINVLEFK